MTPRIALLILVWTALAITTALLVHTPHDQIIAVTAWTGGGISLELTLTIRHHHHRKARP